MGNLSSVLDVRGTIGSQNSPNEQRGVSGWHRVIGHWAFSGDVFLFMAFIAAAYLAMSSWPLIYDETEGQYAGAAHEMLESGSWLVPTNNGIPRLQKPPIVYWLLRSSMTVFGQNEFAARLPNALATLGWIFATYLLGARVGGRKLGFFAAAIFSSLFGMSIFSHLIAPEPFLGLVISLVFWCLVNAWQQPTRARNWVTWAWTFMGLAVLTKGLHGALIPLAVAGLTALVNPQTRSFWRGLLSARGLLIFTLIVVPWYAAMAFKYSGFLADHFLNEQAGHLTNTRWPPDSEQVPMGIFALEHIAFFWPWIVFAPAAILAWRQQKQFTADHVPQRMIWTWMLLTLAGVLFSSRQDYYTMIIWGAVSIWLALPWVAENQAPRASILWPCAVVSGVGMAVAIGTAFLGPKVLGAHASVTPAFQHNDLYTSVTGFSAGAWRHSLWLVAATGLALAVGGIAGATLSRRNKITQAGMVLTGMMIIPFAMVIGGFTFAQDYFSLAKVGSTLNEIAEPHSLVVCEGEPHRNSSLFFYYDRPVHWVGAHADGDFAQRALHIGAELYLTETQFAAKWHSPQQVYFITEQSRLPFWKKTLSLDAWQCIVLAQSGTRILIRNR